VKRAGRRVVGQFGLRINARLHCRCASQALMFSAEVATHKVQGNRVLMILHFLVERIAYR
ncbi:MAG: hypothetical protein ABSA97_12595, partial [Verrucomicrobiia bacterium]